MKWWFIRVLVASAIAVLILMCTASSKILNFKDSDEMIAWKVKHTDKCIVFESKALLILQYKDKCGDD